MKFNEGDKVRHIPTGKIYTVDWRTLGTSSCHIFVKEIDGGWFYSNDLEKFKEVSMDMREEAEISLNNAIIMGKAMDKLMGQCFPSLAMPHTCDECKFYRFADGKCKKLNEYRHSCGSDACDLFEIDPLVEKYC